MKWCRLLLPIFLFSSFQLLLFIHSELSLYPSLQFLIAVLIFAFCFPLFPDCFESLIRNPFLFSLRLEASNYFSGCFQQDCLATFQRRPFRVNSSCAVSNAVYLLVTSAANCTSLSSSRFRGGMLCCLCLLASLTFCVAM